MDLCFEDELQCLKSCYDEKEFFYSRDGKTYILKFILPSGLSIAFKIPRGYPQELPVISLSTIKLTNSEKLSALNRIQDYAINLKGSYMIMDLVIETDHIVSSVLPQAPCIEYPTAAEEEKTHMTIIVIDHMRQKNKYIKSLTNWVKDLSLVGILLFSSKQSILIVQGFKTQLKDFTTRLRTVCVDVDSAGRACKERMSKVLFEGLCSCNFSDFRVQDISAIENLETYFSDMKLGSIYQEYIKPMRSH